MFTKRSYASYSEVPWYRRNWFVILSFILWPLWPALILVLVTGDVYSKTKEAPKRYSSAAKALILVLISLFVLFAFFSITADVASEPRTP
jgi:hypothetical protein